MRMRGNGLKKWPKWQDLITMEDVSCFQGKVYWNTCFGWDLGTCLMERRLEESPWLMVGFCCVANLAPFFIVCYPCLGRRVMGCMRFLCYWAVFVWYYCLWMSMFADLVYICLCLWLVRRWSKVLIHTLTLSLHHVVSISAFADASKSFRTSRMLHVYVCFGLLVLGQFALLSKYCTASKSKMAQKHVFGIQTSLEDGAL